MEAISADTSFVSFLRKLGTFSRFQDNRSEKLQTTLSDRRQMTAISTNNQL